MNQKKIGEFIATLRKEQNMTQEDLASLLYINRESVSKWERGVNIPDPDRLLKLSKIFNVSINEILNGEIITPENKEEIERVPLRILEYKDKKIMHLKILILFIIVISIGAYLMKSYYSHVSIYSLAYDNDKYSFSGMLVNTVNYDYLYLGSINNLDDNINQIEVYSGDEIIYKSKENFNDSTIRIKFYERNIDETEIKINIIKQDGITEDIILNYGLINDNRYIFDTIIESFKNSNNIDNENIKETNLQARTINNEQYEEVVEIKIENEDAIVRYYPNKYFIEILSDDLYVYSLKSEKCITNNCDNKKELIEKAIKELNK